MKALRFAPDRCTGCMRCEMSCSYAQTGSFNPARSVIKVAPLEQHTSYAPYTCVQCAEGWCMTACPVSAIAIGPTGAKVVVDDQCVGCKLCTIACPHGTIFFNHETQKAFKCNLCGGNPACVEVCPTQAILYEEAETADWLGAFAAQRSGPYLATAAAGR